MKHLLFLLLLFCLLLLPPAFHHIVPQINHLTTPPLLAELADPQNLLHNPHQSSGANSGCTNFPGAAMLRGRRRSQEDRLLCVPQLKLPSLDVNGSFLMGGALFGVFDGHLGDEASDLASKSLKQLFLHHVSSLLREGGSLRQQDGAPGQLHFTIGSPSFNDGDTDTPWMSGTVGNMIIREILQDALRKAILDLDAVFSKEARKHGSEAGSTACIAVQLDGHVLIANVGDSKALMCSRCSDAPGKKHGKKQSQYSMRRHKRKASMPTESEALGGLCVKELSDDHRPERFDERARIEASGGFITRSSLSRVNGQLAVSRSIGDVPFKKYGVTSEPEFSGWEQISNNDSFLVIASDGLFEKLSHQDVCNVLHAIETKQDVETLFRPLEDASSIFALPAAVQDLTDLDFEFQMTNLGAVNSMMDAAHDPSGGTCFIGKDAIRSDSWSLDVYALDYQCMASSMARIMARALVEIAYQTGSMDNLSALVVPLGMSLLLG